MPLKTVKPKKIVYHFNRGREKFNVEQKKNIIFVENNHFTYIIYRKLSDFCNFKVVNNLLQ